MEDIIILLISSDSHGHQGDWHLHATVDGEEIGYGWEECHDQFKVLVLQSVNDDGSLGQAKLAGVLAVAMEDPTGLALRNEPNKRNLLLWVHKSDIAGWPDGETDGSKVFARVGSERVFAKVLVHSRTPCGEINLGREYESLKRKTNLAETVKNVARAFAQPPIACISEMIYSIRHELFRLIGTVELDISIGSAAALDRIERALHSFASGDAGPGALEKRMNWYRNEFRDTGGEALGGLEELIAKGRRVAGVACSGLRDARRAGGGEEHVATQVQNSCKTFLGWIGEFRAECQAAEDAAPRKVSS